MSVSSAAMRDGSKRRIERSPRGGVTAYAVMPATIMTMTSSKTRRMFIGRSGSGSRRTLLRSPVESGVSRAGEALLVRVFHPRDECRVTRRIDERVVRGARALRSPLLFQVEELAVLRQPHVGLQRFQ